MKNNLFFIITFSIIGLLFISGCGLSTDEIPTFKTADKTTEQQELLDNCLSIVAAEKEDESICDKVGASLASGGVPTKDLCYKDVAQLKNDITICEKTSNVVSKKICTNAVERGPEEISKETKTIEECEKIENEFSKKLCYYDVVLATGNQELCETKMPDLKSENYCLLRVAGYHKDDNLCYEYFNVK